MSEFVKYQHLERIGTDETEGILDGIVHVFYKIDGTNGSMWWCPENACIRYGSRNRELTYESDNAGFMNETSKDPKYYEFFCRYPNLRLYGEWLVPHSLKTYRDNAWRQFYIFDVYDNTTETILTYEEYKQYLDEFDLNYIPPIMIIKKPTLENLYDALDKCGTFLVEDGKGLGEGLVVKNYNYCNKYGRQTWAKLITNEFKEKHHKEMGAPLVNGSKLVEESIVDNYVTPDFVLKEQAKIINELGDWKSQYIPRLLGVVFYELIKEELWNILKEFNQPRIDFRLLNKLSINKIKEVIKV